MNAKRATRVRFYDWTYNHPYVDGGGVESSDRGFYRLRGVVRTPHGLVEVLGLKKGIRAWTKAAGRSAVLGGEGPVTRLSMVRAGRFMDRTYPRLLTADGAVRAAARFAREIAKVEK